MRITISGTPGSGKSTVAKLLAKRLGCPHLNAGQIFREAAQRRGMTLAAFGVYVDAHPAIDRALDRELVRRARAHRNLILEGRLAGWMTKRARLPAFRVWITAKEATRAARIRKREGGAAAAVLRQLRQRARREVAQYRRVYGLDLRSLAPYDLIIETDALTPAQIAQRILETLG